VRARCSEDCASAEQRHLAQYHGVQHQMHLVLPGLRRRHTTVARLSSSAGSSPAGARQEPPRVDEQPLTPRSTCGHTYLGQAKHAALFGLGLWVSRPPACRPPAFPVRSWRKQLVYKQSNEPAEVSAMMAVTAEPMDCDPAVRLMSDLLPLHVLVGWLLHSLGTCIGMRHATVEQPWIRPGRAHGTATHHVVR
jgi:hypothetical protein